MSSSPPPLLAIKFDARTNREAGYLTVPQEDVGPPALVAKHRDTLLHLLFYVIHTKEGRDLFKANQPDGETEGERARDRIEYKVRLTKALTDKFPALEPALIDVVADAHFDGYEFARRSLEGKTVSSDPEMKACQDRYLQHLQAVLARAQQDGLGPIFSYPW